MKAISVKVDEEAAELFDNMLEQVRAEKGESYTKGAFFDDVINAYANPKVKTITVKEDSPETLELVATLKDMVKDLNQEIENNMSVIGADAKRVSEIMEALELDDAANITAEIRKIQQRAMMVPDKVEVQRPLAENEILFTIPEPHLSLLRETVKRLSTDEKQVTIKDVLLDIFVRYTVEQNAEWFYPFVINQADFKTITGYTQNELQKWLNKK